MRKIIYLFSLILIQSLEAQTLELPKSIMSPNASSLGKYGDVPMDLFTGRANVNVPIHTLNEGGIPLDISLNYDTGGVRVNDVPAWVGQNWTLNAGGVITRSVKGTTYDEQIFDLNQYPESQRGYYYQAYKLNTTNWNSYNYLRQLAINASGGNGGYTDAYMHDLQPDIFTFNFMGHTGKFFLGEDQKWKVSSSSNLKVIIDMADNIIPMNFPTLGYQPGNPDPLKNPKTIGKITINDDKGNKFIFGGTMNNIEFSNFDFFRQSNTLLFATSWYLKEVYNNLGQKIYSFEYERGKYQASFYNWNIYSDYNKPTDGSFWTPGGGCSYTYTPQVVYGGGQLIIPSYLKTINGLKSNTTITFNSSDRISSAYKNMSTEFPLYRTYEKWIQGFGGSFGSEFTDAVQANYFYLMREQDGSTYNYEGGDAYSHLDNFLKKLKWRKLTSITINTPNINKFVNFGYIDNVNQRLQLNSISYDEKKYAFEYNNLAQLPQSYLSTSVDHFGYYNGTAFNMNPSSHYASREINPVTLQYGTLNKIFYPLGGFTTFEYEPHTYARSVNGNSDLVNDIGSTSGIRIKKIADFSDSQNKIEKEYLYTADINSQNPSGILVQKNQYYYPNWSIQTTSNVTYTSNIFSINSIVPMGNFSGSQIEYPTVIEKLSNSGFTKYEFTNYDDYKNIQYSGTISPEHSVFDPKTEFGYKRGKIKFKKYYNQSLIKLKEEEYNYSEVNSHRVRAYAYENYLPCNFVMDGVLTGNAYEIYYSDFNLTSKTIKTYNENGEYLADNESQYYIIRENFGDSFLRNRSRIKTDGSVLSEEYQYTFDKNTTPPYNVLTNNREFSVVKTDKTLYLAPISSSQVDYAEVPIYNNTGGITSNTQILPQKFSEAKGSNPLEEKLIVDKYDTDGNILQAHNPAGKYFFYFYAYNNRYPIMKIEGPQNVPAGATPFGTHASQLRTLLESTTPNISQIISKQFAIIGSTQYPQHQITCYVYKPNVGVTSIMNPNASVEFYNYDSIGRLINIKDINGKILKDFSYELAN